MNNFIITEDLKLVKLGTDYDPSDFDYDKDPHKNGKDVLEEDDSEKIEDDWDEDVDDDWDDSSDSDSEY
ncbi:MAG: hypothetical protein WCY27_02125 [archaeon]|jgi:hypothetical protein|nr:hypothetical protein [archaeon]MDD2477716.1 hypothetical protein [Candidatus ainarchaeum sp.]MDD3084569.1 hypothetical protein [Candidatus ainarchaeum sp.]MDD4221293.1 hypothetical protein [Candidatus ainarchaeum sp.]MDD4662773.1 hypothetical protein [Candidatus ainarchaeum sp.]